MYTKETQDGPSVKEVKATAFEFRGLLPFLMLNPLLELITTDYIWSGFISKNNQKNSLIFCDNAHFENTKTEVKINEYTFYL